MSAGAYSIGSSHVPGLSKLIEECGEVQQVAGKVIGFGKLDRHWDGTDLKDRLEEEIADVRAAALFVVETNGLDRARIEARVAAKLQTFRDWHRAQGAKKEEST